MHALRSYMHKSSELCAWKPHNSTSSGGSGSNAAITPLNLAYDDLIELVETMKKWSDIARSRPLNWQKFCLVTPNCLQFLLYVSVYSDENVAFIALKLLLSATSAPASAFEKVCGKSAKSLAVKAGGGGSRKSKEQYQTQVLISQQLSSLLLNDINDAELCNFVRHFLLEMNTTSMRWSAHSLVLNLFK